MKPRLKLHVDGSVSLTQAPTAYRFNCHKPTRARYQVVANIRRAVGSVSAFHRRFGIPNALVQIALNDGANKGHAMGSTCGALRVMLGLPTISSASTKPLDTELRIPLSALVIARGEEGK